jgi:hypothetical protein
MRAKKRQRPSIVHWQMAPAFVIMPIMKRTIAVIAGLVTLASSPHLLAAESPSDSTETRVGEGLIQDLAKRLNNFPPKEWFETHREEPGFVTVSSMVLALTDLQGHSTRAVLALTNEEASSEDVKDEIILLALAKLYDEDHASAVWVAHFWREKALAANWAYIDAITKQFADESSSQTVDAVAKKKEFGNRVDMILSTYYYDHWSEIRDMIFKSLVTYAVRNEPPKK